MVSTFASRVKVFERSLFLVCALVILILVGNAVGADKIEVSVDVSKTGAPTSKYEFGMFIEHIGPLIYRSLWSEMLDDRKFYFSISSKEPEAQARQGEFPGRQLRKMERNRPGRSCRDGQRECLRRRPESAHSA